MTRSKFVIELSRKLGITGKGTRKAPTIEQYGAGVDSLAEQMASERAASVLRSVRLGKHHDRLPSLRQSRRPHDAEGN